MILFFGVRGPYGFLSNFWKAPFRLYNREWSTVENFYQASKTTDNDEFLKIASAKTPILAKRLGNQCTCRHDWENIVGTPDLHKIFCDSQGLVVERVKDHYMFLALTAKFTQNKELGERLLRTGENPLAEKSTDDYWGIGLTNTGLNKLGRMLQLIRTRLPEYLK